MDSNIDNTTEYLEPKKTLDASLNYKQPILPFSTQKNKVIASIFKLPSANFLEKNPDLKNKKSINDVELKCIK